MHFRQKLQEAYKAGYRSVLKEQVGAPYYPGGPGGGRLPGPSSWNNLIGMINNIMETISQGLPQHSEFDAMVSMVDYDGDGQVTFNDLTIALGLWGQGIMPATAQQYQNGQLIVDDSGLGEQLPPEGEELLNVLSGQGSLGMSNPMQTGATTRTTRPDETGYGNRGRFRPSMNVSARGPQLGMGGPPAMPGGMG